MSDQPHLPDQPPFTPRNVAKFVVQGTIQYKVSKLAKMTIIHHTNFESDNHVVRMSSHLIGWGVSAKLKPHTDKMVDKTADFIVIKRVKRQDKKAKKAQAKKHDKK